MRLDPFEFNSFLSGDVGQPVLWRRANVCPCANPNSGSAKQGCPICSGVGFFWDAEVSSVCGKPSESLMRKWAAPGEYEDGDAVLSVGSDQPLYAAGKMDRIRFLNASHPFMQVCTPGQNDRIYGTVLEITRLYWLSPDGSTIIDGSIPSINTDGTFAFGKVSPPAGVTFSVAGVKGDEYFIFRDLGHQRNSGYVQPMAAGDSGLPIRFPVRKFDLFGRSA